MMLTTVFIEPVMHACLVLLCATLWYLKAPVRTNALIIKGRKDLEIKKYAKSDVQ